MSKLSASGLSEHVASALCYVLGPITGLLFLTIQPYSRNMLVRFHAWQSILTGSLLAGFYIAVILLSLVVPWVVLGVLWLVMMLTMLGGVALWFTLVFRTFAEERMVLPVIGRWAEDRAYHGVSL